MKSLILIFATFILFSFSESASAKHFWRGETLSLQQTQKKWGLTAFEKNKFKDGTESNRAMMAAALLKQQEKFKGKNPIEIRTELGDPDGFYFSDIFPAYIIQSTNDPKGEAWQIVFLLNNDKKVSEIIVHKNCCN